MKKIIDSKELSLSEWLDLIFDPPKNITIVDYKFPTNQHLEEYINGIGDRSEKEVQKLLLQFLIPSTSLGIDKYRLAFIGAVLNDETCDLPNDKTDVLRSQYNQRLIKYAAGRKEIPPWEGITWILDLLPHFPKDALEALSAYFLAHAQTLPDGRLEGLSDALEVIRAKYIGTPSSNAEKLESLLELSSRDFEHMIERLYNAIGYQTTLTPKQKDGGRDIIAHREAPGEFLHLRLECKLYRQNIGVDHLRSLLGIVSAEKVNKGVLVTNSEFTKPAIKFAKENPKLELINGINVISLLNKHLGASWPTKIDRLIMNSRKNSKK